MPRYYLNIIRDVGGDSWSAFWGREDGPPCSNEEVEVLARAADEMVALQAQTVDGTAEEA